MLFNAYSSLRYSIRFNFVISQMYVNFLYTVELVQSDT